MAHKRLKGKILYSSVILGVALFSGVSPVTALADDSNSVKIDKIISSSQDIDKSSEQSLNASITKLQNSISDLESENKQLQSEVDKLAKDLDKLTKDIIARNKQLGSQAVDMQTSTGSDGIIGALTSSKSISDAISKLTAMGTISSANDNAIKDLKKQKNELEKKQKENQAKINEIAENTQKLNEAKANLDVAKLELQAKQEEARKADEAKKAETAKALKAAESKADSVKNATSNLEARSNEAVQPGEGNFTPNYSGNTYPAGQCTWGVKSLLPWVGNYWGNANQWGASAQAEGHTIGNTPKVGAIAVWPEDGGGYGHVAVVSKVNSATSIEVLESNYAGNMSIGNYRGTFNPQAVWSGSSVYYIYQ